MPTKTKRRIAVGLSALAAAAFAGGAYAANQVSGSNTRQAFLDDVAKRLHVTPQQLSAALKGAALDQLSAAVSAGKLTQAQADAIKKRIEQEGGAFPGPFLFGPPGPGPGPGLLAVPGLRGAPGLPGPPGLQKLRGFHGSFRMHAEDGPLAAAAKYLGISDTQLFDELGTGKTLAQIAKARGKSVSGLKDAMTAAIKSKLDKAVASKFMTSAQEQKLLSRLSAMLDDQINGTRKRFGLFGGARGWAPSAPGVPPWKPGGKSATPGALTAPAVPGTSD